MRALICYDDGQLRRLESAIAAIETNPSARLHKTALLHALEIERASLLQYAKRGRAKSTRAAGRPLNRRLPWLEAPLNGHHAVNA